MKIRRVIVVVLVLLMASSSLLACLPDSSMTQTEMECCKKMAGNCDMGGGNHKCCDKTVNQTAPTATITNNIAKQVLAVPVAAGYAQIKLVKPALTEYLGSGLVAISPSPPGFSSVLRN